MKGEFDCSIDGTHTVLHIDGTIRIDGVVISELYSVSILGTERIKIIYDNDGIRKEVILKVLSAPAGQVHEMILQV